VAGPPEKSEGVKRRTAPVRNAAPLARSCGRACHLRDRRSMTRTSAPFGASPRRFSVSGPRFSSAIWSDRRPSANLSRGVVVPPGGSPKPPGRGVTSPACRRRLPPRSQRPRKGWEW